MHSSTNKISSTDVKKESGDMMAILKAWYSGATDSFGGSHTTDPSKTNTTGYEKISIGANGATDVKTFLAKVKEPNNWKLVQYVEFYPTLLLLKNDYSWMLAECVKLLRNNYYRPAVANLQKQIDIYSYMLNLDSAISPDSF